MEKYVLTERQLLSLLTKSIEYDYLDRAGVDNWNGYDEAFELLKEEGFEECEELAREKIKKYEKLN